MLAVDILVKVEENCNTHKSEIEPNSSYLLLLPLAVNSPHLKCRVSYPDFIRVAFLKLSYPLHGAFKHVARCEVNTRLAWGSACSIRTG